ncbi:glycoside hydrolase family protein [Desulfobulbus sp.]|uniref:glycoside hydrolase family protein n=1 Tax=Desulfobulbus sp. TaxID=895 RepID=UPI00286F6AB9|nr:glycoside hydrolase family protein [Desulfobulbus sp.]
MARDLRQAVELIKSFEGILDGDPATVNLDPYLCPAGCWTIGWGHVVTDPHGRMLKGTGNKELARAVYPDGITMAEAEVLLADDVRRFAAGVERLVKVPLAATRFCALVSFAYNVGIGALEKSTLLRLLNEGNIDQVPDQFMRWTKAGGKELAGLKRRREAEMRLWLSAETTAPELPPPAGDMAAMAVAPAACQEDTAAPEAARNDALLFLTNRYPEGVLQLEPGRAFVFDPRNNAPGNVVFACRREADGAIATVGRDQFMLELKRSPYRQLLFYIHGYSNLPEDVFGAAGELQRLCDGKSNREVLVVPVIWPCDNDLGLVGDYWDDQKAADASAISFARALQRFVEWRNTELNGQDAAPCLKRINVLAHSMGNRVLRETLAAWNKYDLASGVPLLFRNTFLVAADIENESLHRGKKGQLICDASRNVVVYFASDDLALRSSKAANFKNKIASRRLGHSGPEDMRLAPSNVFAVDCDEVNTDYDAAKGHSYFRSGRTPGRGGVVFDHIFECLRTGRVLLDDPQRRTMILRE